MASVFGHAIASFTASRFFPKVLMSKSVVILGIVSSIMPDIDVLAFRYGIPYKDMFGHRGITHSIFFAVIWALVLAWFVHKKTSSSDRKILFWFYFIATVSHSVLDALTTGGLGVAFFAPFNNDRYFLPWKIIQVSPLGMGMFFSKWGIKVILSEIKYIGVPCLFLWLLRKLIRSKS